MTSTPATKRRRLDTASATLAKPFVSPFKTPAKHTPIENDTSATPAATRPTERPPPASPPNPTTSARPTPNSKPKRTLASHHAPPSTPTTLDPVLTPLLKTHRALEARLRALHAEIDTLAQAVRIESGDSDAELGALVAKWTVASREAAEEVFGDVRDRVNRMGGVGAWREMGRRREEWRGGGFGFDEGGEKGGEEREGERRADAGDVEGREEEEEGRRVQDEDVGADDDTFTMDMMLRSLNVELDVIGFDKETQRWVD